MKLIGENIKKFEYVLDIFKGTCELNNYDCIKTPIKEDSSLRTSNVLACLKLSNEHENLGKVYFYGPVFASEESIELGAISFKKRSIYRAGEIINLAVKFINNIGIDEVKIKLASILDEHYKKELIENLMTLDIDIEEGDVEYSDLDKICAFDILIEGQKVGHGGGKEEYSYFKIDYQSLAQLCDHDVMVFPLDVFIKPESSRVLSDAFIIGSNLKDAGLKVEVDYDGDIEIKDLDANYLIEFSEKDIANYEVKLIDLKTKEEKTIKIDNLVEELAFM